MSKEVTNTFAIEQYHAGKDMWFPVKHPITGLPIHGIEREEIASTLSMIFKDWVNNPDKHPSIFPSTTKLRLAKITVVLTREELIVKSKLDA